MAGHGRCLSAWNGLGSSKFPLTYRKPICGPSPYLQPEVAYHDNEGNHICLATCPRPPSHPRFTCEVPVWWSTSFSFSSFVSVVLACDETQARNCHAKSPASSWMVATAHLLRGATLPSGQKWRARSSSARAVVMRNHGISPLLDAFLNLLSLALRKGQEYPLKQLPRTKKCAWESAIRLFAPCFMENDRPPRQPSQHPNGFVSK